MCFVSFKGCHAESYSMSVPWLFIPPGGRSDGFLLFWVRLQRRPLVSPWGGSVSSQGCGCISGWVSMGTGTRGPQVSRNEAPGKASGRLRLREDGISGLGVQEVCSLNPFSLQHQPQTRDALAPCGSDPALAKAVEAVGSADELGALPSNGLPSTEGDQGDTGGDRVSVRRAGGMWASLRAAQTNLQGWGGERK